MIIFLVVFFLNILNIFFCLYSWKILLRFYYIIVDVFNFAVILFVNKISKIFIMFLNILAVVVYEYLYIVIL